MRVTKFKNIEEEAEFWDKTDTSEMLRTGELTKAEWDNPGKCPLCQTGNLRHRFIDVDLCEGAVTIHGVEVYYCPLCKRTIVPEITQTKIEKIINQLHRLKEEEISIIVNAI